MPFLPPNQQHQSTEGTSTEGDLRTYIKTYDSNLNDCSWGRWLEVLSKSRILAMLSAPSWLPASATQPTTSHSHADIQCFRKKCVWYPWSACGNFVKWWPVSIMVGRNVAQLIFNNVMPSVFRRENVVALQWAEMRMVRWMCGVKVTDRFSSNELREI